MQPSNLDEALSKGSAEKLKEAEDRVALLLNGGHCVKTQHEPASQLHLLVALRQLRLLLPHVSSSPVELENLIRQEAKKLG